MNLARDTRQMWTRLAMRAAMPTVRLEVRLAVDHMLNARLALLHAGATDANACCRAFDVIAEELAYIAKTDRIPAVIDIERGIARRVAATQAVVDADLARQVVVA